MIVRNAVLALMSGNLQAKTFLGIEAVHMHYICKKCNSEITEEFTLNDVFIDKGQ